MKSAFCLFLSLYVLLLSVLPCADGCMSLRRDKQPTQVAADDHTHEDSRTNGDLCSPLCSCVCCGTVICQPPHFAFSFTPPRPLTQTLLPGATPSLPTVTLSAWQPPQLI